MVSPHGCVDDKTSGWELAEEDTQEALRLSPGNAKAKCQSCAAPNFGVTLKQVESRKLGEFFCEFTGTVDVQQHLPSGYLI